MTAASREALACPPRWEEVDRNSPKLGPIWCVVVALLLSFQFGYVGSETNKNVRISANLVLQSTVERIFATVSDPKHPGLRGVYSDKAHGIFLVRGENVLLLGEIDLDKDDDPPLGYERAEFGLVEKLAQEQKAAEKTKEAKRLKKLTTHGFEGENMGEILL